MVRAGSPLLLTVDKIAFIDYDPQLLEMVVARKGSISRGLPKGRVSRVSHWALDSNFALASDCQGVVFEWPYRCSASRTPLIPFAHRTDYCGRPLALPKIHLRAARLALACPRKFVKHPNSHAGLTVKHMKTPFRPLFAFDEFRE